MTKARFLDTRRPAWQRFHDLLAKAERHRMRRLTGEEVSEFSQLFRSVCYDLATVRSRDWGTDLERYLNDLVARGHNNFYRSPPRRPLELVRFLTVQFPRLVRANIAYFWVSLALFCIPGLICGVLVARDPTFAAHVLPGSTLAQFEAMYERTPTPDEHAGAEGVMVGFYVHNNVGIAFRCFATGIFFGVGTVVVLVQNSIVLGAISAFVLARGHGDQFTSFVISHGAFELTALVISGAAGLVIGDAVVRPGSYRLADTLKRRGLVGVQLAVGAGVMLGIAALIEAYWSPLPIPSMVKYTAGGMLWVLVVLYLAFAGRGSTDE